MKDNNEYPETAEQAADNWVKSLDTYMPDYPTTDHIAYPSFIQGANWMKGHLQPANNDYAVKVIEAELKKYKEIQAEKGINNDYAKARLEEGINLLSRLLTKLTPNN